MSGDDMSQLISSNIEIRGYSAYVEKLKILCKSANQDQEGLAKALDGGAYHALRTLVPLEARRETGSFFTSSHLAEQLAKRAARNLKKTDLIIDPTCGAGALLIAISYHLPLEKTLKKTLEAWGERIYGFDLHSDFVKATKLRLLLLAASRFQQTPDFTDVKYFKNIKVGDALNNLDVMHKMDCVLLNPPYVAVKSPKDCEWAYGNISSAALFLEKTLDSIKPSSKIYGILPEVIRCGSRYSPFRELISKQSSLLFTESVGIFDNWTDVDVFITGLKKTVSVKKQGNPDLFLSPRINRKKVGDFFEISVGPVVPYRDAKRGERYPYIEVKDLPQWGNKFEADRYRRYEGTVIMPPFVAIRRNSRPGDNYRAKAVFVSHSDSDHVVGISTLLLKSEIQIEHLYVNPDVSKSGKRSWEQFRRAVAAAAKRGVKISSVNTTHPNPIDLGNVKIVPISPEPAEYLVGPSGEGVDGKKIDSNSISVVLKILYKDEPRALLAGDMEQTALDRIVANKHDLSASILVFPHHGGLPGDKDPIEFSRKLCELVSPEIIVFSNSRSSKFDNPRPEIFKGIPLKCSRIACTQLSQSCQKDTSGLAFKHLSDIPAKGVSDKSSCGGSMIFNLEKINAATLDGHRDFVKESISEGLCRAHNCA